MQLSLVNKYGSDFLAESQIKVLWSFILVGQRLDFSGELADLFHLKLNWDKFPEKTKMLFLFESMRKGGMAEEEVRKSEQMYKHIREIQQIKHKTKRDMDIFMMGQHIVKEMIAIKSDNISVDMQNNNVYELLPFVTTNIDNIDSCLFAWNFDDINKEANVQQRIKSLMHRIVEKPLLPVLSEDITTFANSVSMDDTKFEAQPNCFLSDLVFKIPAPESLTSSQIKLIRNKLSISAWAFFDSLQSLYDSLHEMVFAVENYEAIIKLYTEKTKDLKNKLQLEIENNELLNELKNSTTYRTNYCVYACIGSFNTVGEYYMNEKIISESEMLYIKEFANEKIKLENCRMFLFMKHEAKEEVHT